MARHVLAFDLDLTLCDHLGDVNLASSRSVKAGCYPHRAACRRVVELVQAGHEVHVISGRGMLLRNVTRTQLEEWICRDVTLVGRLHLQAYWHDYAAMRTWKAQVLKDIGAAIYVGDHTADALAADDAGIPFLHANDFRAGADLLGLVGDAPVDDDRLALEGPGGVVGKTPVGEHGGGTPVVGPTRARGAVPIGKGAVRRQVDHGVDVHAGRPAGRVKTAGAGGGG